MKSRLPMSFYDSFFDEVITPNSNLPYNIIQLQDTKNFIVLIACAGFSKDNISITTSDNKLLVEGVNYKETSVEGDKYVHKGISGKDFKHEFQLSRNMEVASANIEDGMLSIKLDTLIPENEKPKRIDIL